MLKKIITLALDGLKQNAIIGRMKGDIAEESTPLWERQQRKIRGERSPRRRPSGGRSGRKEEAGEERV